MDTVAGMKTLIAVVDAGSFTGAAERLGMSTALASKYVGQLEKRLGVRLLHRTTRSLNLTEIGQVYVERCRNLLNDFDELEAAVQDRQSAPRGGLIITAPTTFGEMYLTPALARFMAGYPEITVELRLTDRFVGLAEEGVDLAIRIAELEDSSLIARHLAPARVVACAAPAYLERFGEPARPEDLTDHNCIVDTNFRISGGWPFLIDGKRITISVSGRFSVNSAQAARAMVVAGAGIGLVPTYAIGEDIKNGRIVPLLMSHEALDLSVYAVYLPNRHLTAKVRAFIDFMVGEFGSRRDWVRSE